MGENPGQPRVRHLVRAREERGGVLLARTSDLLGALRALPAKPTRSRPRSEGPPSPTARDLENRTSFDTNVAVRILCWFPTRTLTLRVVALVGGDKKVIQDLWYDSATPEPRLLSTNGSAIRTTTKTEHHEDKEEETSSDGQ